MSDTNQQAPQAETTNAECSLNRLVSCQEGDDEEVIIREITFVEKITSTGRRGIVEVKSQARLGSGQELSPVDCKSLARKYLSRANPDPERYIFLYPDSGLIKTHFEWFAD